MPSSNSGNSCNPKDTSEWAALGCSVADPSGTCVGSGCSGAGLTPIGALSSVTDEFDCQAVRCFADGGDFDVSTCTSESQAG